MNIGLGPGQQCALREKEKEEERDASQNGEAKAIRDQNRPPTSPIEARPDRQALPEPHPAWHSIDFDGTFLPSSALRGLEDSCNSENRVTAVLTVPCRCMWEHLLPLMSCRIALGNRPCVERGVASLAPEKCRLALPGYIRESQGTMDMSTIRESARVRVHQQYLTSPANRAPHSPIPGPAPNSPQTPDTKWPSAQPP